MHVILRTKHEQRYRTSVLLKRDGLVCRARALALERRQDVVYMRRPDMVDKPIGIASLVMCRHHTGTFGHLCSLIYESLSTCGFYTFLQTSINNGQLG
jgi:hypothetical protein